MRANEEGIKADWDVEFLHDYRTALRRTRSALSQITDVFPPETTKHYKEAFGLLGERSNWLRDLDVYLLSEPDYRAMLPDAMREHLAPLLNYLRAQRQQALQEVIGNLNSLPYAAMMEAWAAFLHEPIPDAPNAPNATLPIDEVARRQIDKRYRQVIKDGNQIRDHTQDELVHALRIDCKKLRYLMEFFASLFPKQEIDTLIGQLRKSYRMISAHSTICRSNEPTCYISPKFSPPVMPKAKWDWWRLVSWSKSSPAGSRS